MVADSQFDSAKFTCIIGELCIVICTAVILLAEYVKSILTVSKVGWNCNAYISTCGCGLSNSAVVYSIAVAVRDDYGNVFVGGFIATNGCTGITQGNCITGFSAFGCFVGYVKITACVFKCYFPIISGIIGNF